MKKIIVVAVLFLNLILSIAFAADAFVVKKIEIEGLQRIAPATVYSYLPIKQGELLRPDKTGEIIKALYKTGFFEHITLAREGNILVITVVERPTIGELKISGNSIVATDKLTTVMKSVGVAEGRVYDQELLEKIKQSLLNQYYQLGRYNARVDVTVARMSRNRVQVKIDISEGLIAKVRRINIIGNHVFSESKLERQLLITTPGLLTIFTQTDRYSQEKLDASLDSLRNYYLDYGYLKFTVKSSQVEITPDRKSIFLTIVIDEGMPYTVKDIVLRGDLILPRDQIRKFIPIEPGDTFSRQSVINANKSISNALGEKGYAFSTVSLEPALDDAHKEVTLVFDVKPGKRAYVRHIYFTNNVKTNDLTLRRKMEQMESSVVSTSKLEQSKHALSLLPYLKDVQMSMQPVGDSDDQVDINYKLTEDNSAQATASIGYSQSEGILLGVGLTQKNFLGTGETLGLNATRSAVQQYYGMSFTDPYYTADGISRTINVSSSRFFPGNSKQERIAQGFTTNQYSASVVYGIPLGQEQNVFNTLQLGYGYESTLVHPRATISNQLIDFNNRNGRHFQQIDLIGGFSRDSRDKAIFPTKGMLHTLGGTLFAPVNNTALKYYMLSYDLKWYHPLTNSLIATTKGAFGYGSSFDGGAQNFPYFKDYYGGGPENVRGYTAGTLGPKDSLANPSGGNVLVYGSVGLIFPNYISDNLRTTLFVDAGNVYNTFDNRKYNGSGSGPLRFSTGIEADWLTPMGMIDVMLSKALNPQCNPTNRLYCDSTDAFQFSLGANFG